MQKEEFINIADKVSEGLATDQEKQLFLFHLGIFAAQNPEWEKLVPEFRQQIEGEVKSNIRVQVFGEDKQKSKIVKLWPRMIGIAATVALVVLGVYLFNYRNDKQVDSNVLTAQDIIPGTVGATLTLANGKKIKLSDAANGEIAKEAGISVTKTADGQLVYEIKETTGDPNKINTLSTAKGETYILTLPDGSMVWLNAASSITYSANLLVHGERKLKLQGEGYFEISKDKAHPFIVESKGQSIKVLGTHFNVSAYGDDHAITTTLLEGSVLIGRRNSSLSLTDTVILKPNQQAVNTQTNINVKNVDASIYTDWKDGVFTFKNESLISVLKKISRWYNVDVEYNIEHSSTTYSGTISRYTDIKNALKLLEDNSDLRFKLIGRKLIVFQD